MSKLIAAINISLDGICDHTQGVADAALHRHYRHLLDQAGAILYGRITYQLMEYWKGVVENPTGEKDMDEFAISMDKVHKIVFSHTLKSLDWKTAELATESPEEVVNNLKNKLTKNIYVGSPGLINYFTQLGMIDEYQLCIHPVIVGKGLRLFHDLDETRILQLTDIKKFESGVVLHFYQPR